MKLRKFLDYSEAVTYIEKNKKMFTKLYIADGMTARKVAENQNLHYDNNFQKGLLRVCGKKGLGLGGARSGSGNKKGVKFCGNCGKKLTANHECKK